MLTVACIVSMGVGTPVNMCGYMHVPMYCMILFTHKKGNMHIITYINIADRCLAKQPKYPFPFTKQNLSIYSRKMYHGLEISMN